MCDISLSDIIVKSRWFVQFLGDDSLECWIWRLGQCPAHMRRKQGQKPTSTK